MESNGDERLTFRLYDLFLYLSSAVICIPRKYQHEVFMGMAHKLEEWNNTSRSDLRLVFEELGIDFDESCIHCNEPLPDWDWDEAEEGEETVCEACKQLPPEER